MRILILLLALLGVASTATAQTAERAAFDAAQWADPDLGASVREGFADADHLWLRGQSGKIVRFDRSTGARIVVAEDVIDMLPDWQRLWILSSNDNGLSLRDLRTSGPPVIQGHTPGQAISLFPTSSERPGILTTRLVLTPSGDNDWSERSLAALLDGASATTADGAGGLYIGLNQGEWGGGLRRIDMVTGAIAFVTEPSEELCGGLINPECDPVVGAFPDPDQPGCIITATGLAHLSLGTGHVLRVCGETIASVFRAPTRISEPNRLVTGEWPFFSLTQTHDGWIAISHKRYFRSHSGRVLEHPLPVLRDWSDRKSVV